jgi:hypothetical protein
MARGICRALTESGATKAVRTDYGNGLLNDLDVDYYEQEGYGPPWQSLDPCSGTGPGRGPYILDRSDK